MYKSFTPLQFHLIHSHTPMIIVVYYNTGMILVIVMESYLKLCFSHIHGSLIRKNLPAYANVTKADDLLK